MALIFTVTYNKNDGSGTTLYCEDGSKNVLDGITTVGANWGETPQNWSRTGYVFLYWNTAADGSGTSIEPGYIFSGTSATVYAIWQAEAGDAVIISLGETEIASMNATGTKTLATQGTYVADDITIEYTKPAVPTPTLQNKTVSPTTSSQSVTADSGYDGLGTVTVSAISPTKSAQTYTPTTSNQTIASGRWLTGTQTILGDANLVAGNIKKDVSIFNVTGTYEGSGGGGSIEVSSYELKMVVNQRPAPVAVVKAYQGYGIVWLYVEQVTVEDITTTITDVASINGRAYFYSLNNAGVDSIISAETFEEVDFYESRGVGGKCLVSVELNETLRVIWDS